MITRALYDKMYRLATLDRITTQDAKELEAAVQLFNIKYSVCLKCVQQLKHGQRLILNYLSQQQIIEDIELMVDDEEPLFDMQEPEPIVDEVEADKVGCTKCRRSKKTKG